MKVEGQMVTGSGQHPRREEGRWVRLPWSGCPSTVVVCLPPTPQLPPSPREGKGRDEEARMCPRGLELGGVERARRG